MYYVLCNVHVIVNYVPKLLNTDNLVSIERTETKRSFYFCAVQAYYDMHSVV